MADPAPFRSQAQVDAAHNLSEFIREARDELTLFNDRPGFQWEAPVWPEMRWVKLEFTGGRQGLIGEHEQLDPAFINFAKAYFRWKNSERPTLAKRERGALRCIEAALLTVTGSAELQELSVAVLDEAAEAARKSYSPRVAYQIGQNIRGIADFVSSKHLVPVDLSTWKSPIGRPLSTRRTGDEGRAEIESKMPSQAGMDAMAEIFANDPEAPAIRMISSFWALGLSAPWRACELLKLRVDAEFERVDDIGVTSYGIRYCGAKGFGEDVKWVPKVMEPVTREAFRRIREMTAPARAFARHLEDSPDIPYLYPDAPSVGLDESLTLEQKAQYLRRPAPNSRPGPVWQFDSMRQHWSRVRAELPKEFPFFDPEDDNENRMKWSEALFCIFKDFLNRNEDCHPTDFCHLDKLKMGQIADLLMHSPKRGNCTVLEQLGYTEPDGSPIRLTTHMPRHYLSTLAERGVMAQENLAKWAGRANLKDNRVYNHMSEDEKASRACKILSGTELAGKSASAPVKRPTTPAEFNKGERGPTHKTLYGVCEHDFAMLPCLQNHDCLNCPEHVCVKGDRRELDRIKAKSGHYLEECEKAFDAIRNGYTTADRWLEHALKSLIVSMQWLLLLESDDIEDGAEIRLADDRVGHSHLRRALDQRLPRLHDDSLPGNIKTLIERCINGEALIDAAGDINRRDHRWVAGRHKAHLGRSHQADRKAAADPAGPADSGASPHDQGGVSDPQGKIAQGNGSGRRRTPAKATSGTHHRRKRTAA